VGGDWKRLHNKELHNLYASTEIIKGDQVKEDALSGACSTHWRDDKYIHRFCRKTWRDKTTRKT
jgi:hypothetical protein